MRKLFKAADHGGRDRPGWGRNPRRRVRKYGENAATVPPWEVVQAPATNPAVFPNEAGGLTFYNSSGQVITGGNITDNPIAAYIQGNHGPAARAPTLVDLERVRPDPPRHRPSLHPGNWSGVGLGEFESSELSSPSTLGFLDTPRCTRVRTWSLVPADRKPTPNTDTSTTDGYAGIYVLRLFTFRTPTSGTSTNVRLRQTFQSTRARAHGRSSYAPSAATTTTLPETAKLTAQPADC